MRLLPWTVPSSALCGTSGSEAESRASTMTRRTLPDHLAPGLDIVSIGLNPSVYSVERGFYFARPGNRFWPALNASGLIPEPLAPSPEAVERLFRQYRIGFTDLVKRATVRAMANILETHRSYIGPPGMDRDAVASFRGGVNAALRDPELLAETRKSARPVAPMEGATQQTVIGEITKASANLAPILKAAVKEIQ